MAVKKILFNGNENPATITYDGQNVKEVIFKNSPTSSGEKVWGKYNLKYTGNPIHLKFITNQSKGDTTSPAYGFSANRSLTNFSTNPIFLGEIINVSLQPNKGTYVNYYPSGQITVSNDISVNYTVEAQEIPLYISSLTGVSSYKLEFSKKSALESLLSSSRFSPFYSGSSTAWIYDHLLEGDQIKCTLNPKTGYEATVVTKTVSVDDMVTLPGKKGLSWSFACNIAKPTAPIIRWNGDWDKGNYEGWGYPYQRNLVITNQNSFPIKYMVKTTAIANMLMPPSGWNGTVPANDSVIVRVKDMGPGGNLTIDRNGSTVVYYDNALESSIDLNNKVIITNGTPLTAPSLSIPASSDNSITIYNPNNKSGTYDFMITCEDSAGSVFVDEWTITGTVAATGNTSIYVNDIIRDFVGSTITATGPFRLEGTITINGETFNYLEEREMDYLSS